MDWLTFFSKIVEALAWPAVVVLVACMFKGKLTKLFEDVTELKGLGIEAKFARGAKEALAEVEVLEAAQPAEPQLPDLDEFDPNAPIDDPELARIQSINMLLVMTNPKAAVMIGRSNIEAAVKRLATREGVLIKGPANLSSALKALVQQNIISRQVFETAMELTALGNKANHGDFEPSVDAAKDFAIATNKLVRLLLSQSKTYP